MSKKLNWQTLAWFLLGAFVFFFAVSIDVAYSSDDDDSDGDGGSTQNNEVNVENGFTFDYFNIEETSSQSGAQASMSMGEGVASNQGNEQSVNFTSPKRAPDTYMIMQNAVESCGRTFGISGANTSGSWTFGLPIPRSWTPTCDLWKAANFAKASGFLNTSYTFQCSIKVVRKVLGDERCQFFEEQSMIELGILSDVPDVGGIYNQAAQGSGWLMADITEEEYLEQHEEVEEQLEQQQAELDRRAELIVKYDAEAAARDAEIERLKHEHEAEEAADEARRAKIRAIYAKKEEE